MKITKITHNALIIEFADVKILVDPGKDGLDQYEKILNLSHIIITDAHGDHLNAEGLNILLKNNPTVQLIVSEDVMSKISTLDIVYDNTLVIINRTTLEIGNKNIIFDLAPHMLTYKGVTPCNDILVFTIEKQFFYPSDTLAKPPYPVDTLALNVVTPFGTTQTFVDYALEVNPKKVFNVHDGYTNKDFTVGFYSLGKKVLGDNGIEYTFMKDGDSIEIAE